MSLNLICVAGRTVAWASVLKKNDKQKKKLKQNERVLVGLGVQREKSELLFVCYFRIVLYKP